LEDIAISIALTGTGGLMSRLGKIIRFARQINGTRGNTAAHATSGTPTWGTTSISPTITDLGDAQSGILAQYQATNPSLALVAGLPAICTSLYSTVEQTIVSLQSIAQSTLIYMANADTPLAALTLQNAMALLYTQMVANGNVIQSNTVSASVTASGSNTGYSVLVVSVTDQNGLPMQYPFPETISVTCTSVATLHNEMFSATGTIAQSDAFDVFWPMGSGTSGVTFNNTDFTANASNNNLLTNSDFESFVNTANMPDQWVKLVGTIGTTIKQGTTAHDGTSSLQYVGDGSTLTSIQQTFGNATTGTAGTVAAPPVGFQTSPVTSGVYAVSFWAYVDVQPAAGVLKVDLVNASEAVINDNSGTPNSVTLTVSTMTGATWTQVTAVFRLPTNLPSSVSLRINLTTAMSSGSNLFIDTMAFCPMTQLYTGGPFVAMFSGTTAVAITDTYSITVSNNLASGGGIFMDWFERFFQMRAVLGITLPNQAILSQAITGASDANPIVITSNGHGLTTGQLVTITGVGGNTSANVTASAVTVVSANTFSIAVAGNGSYTSGGVWTLSNAPPDSLCL
jgi:hypothetical protein